MQLCGRVPVIYKLSMSSHLSDLSTIYQSDLSTIYQSNLYLSILYIHLLIYFIQHWNRICKMEQPGVLYRKPKIDVTNEGVTKSTKPKKTKPTNKILNKYLTNTKPILTKYLTNTDQILSKYFTNT